MARVAMAGRKGGPGAVRAVYCVCTGGEGPSARTVHGRYDTESAAQAHVVALRRRWLREKKLALGGQVHILVRYA